MSEEQQQQAPLIVSEEQRLERLEEETLALEASPHHGFTDAIKVSRLRDQMGGFSKHNSFMTERDEPRVDTRFLLCAADVFECKNRSGPLWIIARARMHFYQGCSLRGTETQRLREQ